MQAVPPAVEAWLRMQGVSAAAIKQFCARPVRKFGAPSRPVLATMQANHVTLVEILHVGQKARPP